MIEINASNRFMHIAYRNLNPKYTCMSLTSLKYLKSGTLNIKSKKEKHRNRMCDKINKLNLNNNMKQTTLNDMIKNQRVNIHNINYYAYKNKNRYLYFDKLKNISSFNLFVSIKQLLKRLDYKSIIIKI